MNNVIVRILGLLGNLIFKIKFRLQVLWYGGGDKIPKHVIARNLGLDKMSHEEKLVFEGLIKAASIVPFIAESFNLNWVETKAGTLYSKHFVDISQDEKIDLYELVSKRPLGRALFNQMVSDGDISKRALEFHRFRLTQDGFFDKLDTE